MSSSPVRRIQPATVAERRRTRRIQVLLPVEVEMAGEKDLAVLTQLSRAGARVELPAPGMVGQSLTIRRSGIDLQARIVWTDGLAAGLWFPEPLEETAFLQLRRRTAG